MKKTKFSHKVMAVFLTLSFLPSLLPVNFLLASNNGPTAPEASSFEPVDATDMVNLATGDLSYVLPLMNVPSPEGGYPLSLAYHAGIAMDQEASWTGLGWNVNPGAITRSVNGYPDDWDGGRFKEYFYNKGNTYTDYSVGVSFTASGGESFGLDLAWGDSRSFGGSVSLGTGLFNKAGDAVGSVGLSVGTSGVSVNGGYSGTGRFGIGGSIGTNGIGLGASYGFQDKIGSNGKNYFNQRVGLGVSSSWSGDISANASYSAGEGNKKNSIGVNFSSNGVGVAGKIGGAGTGANVSSFSHSISSSDYTVKQSGYNIPVFIPVGGGILSFNFGKTKTRVYLDVLEDNIVNGTLYFKNDRAIMAQTNNNTHAHSDSYGFSLASTYSLTSNNGVFPNYDGYRVTGQGIGGSISPRHQKNGAIIGLNKRVDDNGPIQDYTIRHDLPGPGSSHSNATDFTALPDFQFDNDYVSSWLQTEKDFHGNLSNNYSIFNYLTSTAGHSLSRRMGGRYVEYYTNAELASGTAFNQGLLKTISNIPVYSSSVYEPDGIGAFKVVAPDGKTYHYTVPVFNHEVVARQYGMDPQYPNQNDSFYEKRQLKNYATHWLLTAVTGPDFVDMNNNQKPDDGDYGYWTAFDYGQWTDGYIWYNPHGKEFEEDETNTAIKNYSWGRKEIYYLDKVITRTHTALFVKEERSDARGKQLNYQHRKDDGTPVRNFNLREQSLLRLKEIILVKNSDLGNITKSNTTNISSAPSANTTYSINWFDPVADKGGFKWVRCSKQNNILDAKDGNNWGLLKNNASKVVSFSYDYSLASGAPYTTASGRLTLKNVAFKGKGDVQLMPSYAFAYNNSNKPYVLNDVDEWGYDKHDSDQWSLTEITMPTGSKILVDYEKDVFSSSINQNISFTTIGNLNSDNTFRVTSNNADFDEFGIELNDEVPVSHRKLTGCSDGNPGSYSMDVYDGTAKVIEEIDARTIRLKLNGNPNNISSIFYGITCSSLSAYNNYTRISMDGETFDTGIRVKSIATTDGINTYKTEYDYNVPGTTTTSGVVSYIPFSPFAAKEVPFGMELPAPIAMYSHVTTKVFDSNTSNNTPIGYTVYNFKTLPKRSSSGTNFGDILQFTQDFDNFFNSTANASVSIGDLHVADNTACLGQLLSTATYNQYGQLMTKTINNYALPENAPQGIVRESFQQYKKVDYDNINDKWHLHSSTRTIYSSSLLSTTIIQGGFSSTTYFDEYDTLSGQLLETTTTQSDGTEFKTETVPAYTRYSEMGSKVTSPTYKNMLTQEAMNKTYIKDNGTFKLVGAGINTWSPNTYTPSGSTNVKVWRKHKTYTWDGSSDSDGFFTSYSGDFDGFNWSTSASSQPSDWKLVSQINTYDPFSMVLEVEDINGNKASTRMGDDNTKIIASGNAPLAEMHYSGAEYLDGSTFDGGIDDVGRTTERAHTGMYSIKVTSDQGFRKVLSGHRSGDYKISVWASKDNYNNARIYDGTGLRSFNGEKVIAGDWVLLNHYVTLSSSNKTIYVRSNSGTLYYDDVRIHPVQSTMSSYVYNNWDELTHIIGSNNLATQYVYNEAGQLCSTYAEIADQTGLTGGFKVVSNTKLQYKNGSTGTCSNISGSISTDESSASTNCNVTFDLVGLGGVNSWNVNYGDGNSDSGTGIPPATITHSYNSAGNKTATLTLNGQQSYTTSISISASYYFNNASCSSCSFKTIRLNGTPGDPIIYSASTGGSGSGFNGYVVVNNVRRDLPTTGSSVSSVNAGTFPSSGYVECRLSVNNSSGGTGSTSLSIQKPGNCGSVTTSVSMSPY